MHSTWNLINGVISLLEHRTIRVFFLKTSIKSDAYTNKLLYLMLTRVEVLSTVRCSRAIQVENARRKLIAVPSTAYPSVSASSPITPLPNKILVTNGRNSLGHANYELIEIQLRSAHRIILLLLVKINVYLFNC